MLDPVDFGLARLSRSKIDTDLDGLEREVLARVAKGDGEFFGRRPLEVQLAVSCAALLIGLAMAQALNPAGVGIRSETVVLSDDSPLAPSISLEGGA